ncbi:DUF4344 domain-containing metallopeptidase [Paracoccus sp. p4-l81]|uniref:DUF4344 domain-containing metallopeptidase n=1 Tax=unclassified Paracoccus (in: a-proteobacteria) TaxID=2688777 RepID=UPI0035B86686
MLRNATLMAALLAAGMAPALAHAETAAPTETDAAAAPWPEDPVPVALDASTRQDFIEANVLAIFYHELGHALIHVEDLPVLGREEEAVDGLSAIMIDALWEAESAENMLRLNGAAWIALANEAMDDPPAYWDVHALDRQRYYNQLCLIYGADPDRREGVAKEMGLPEERAEGCPDEYALAARSWGTMLELIEKDAPGAGPGQLVAEMKDIRPEDAGIAAMLTTEIKDFNAHYRLARDITVGMESCGEANAFYDLDLHRVIICTEFGDELARLHDGIVAAAEAPTEGAPDKAAEQPAAKPAP